MVLNFTRYLKIDLEFYNRNKCNEEIMKWLNDQMAWFNGQTRLTYNRMKTNETTSDGSTLTLHKYTIEKSLCHGFFHT